MRFSIENPNESTITLFRRLGYSFQRYDNDDLSFVRVLSSSGYPRFHIYAKERKGGIDMTIHFDAKKFTYGNNSSRHHAEYDYDSETPLKDEIDRIMRVIGGLAE